MAANTALNVTGLNFDTIRANLRDFIAAKPDFADYDFTDSALATLLDLLAYNTYYNAFYTSMAASESFIDSAQFYDSVVSRAKLVGYTPVSAKGATANVLITFTTATPTASRSTLTIAKNTQFTSVINSVSYVFVTPKSYTVSANSTNGFAQYVSLVEGLPLTHRYLYTSANTSFVLPNTDVETDSIGVSITSSGTTTTYVKADDVLTVNSSSKIYYVEADRDLKYKVGFGDNILGKRPDYNSTISISYRVCNSTLGNGAANFTASSSIAGETNFTLTPIGKAEGGASQEDIESIRFNAPKIYETQNRAVTASDYQRIILRDNRDLQAVSVWGGEENNPPVYGKVYVTVKPLIGTLISNARKEQIKINLRKYSMQSIDSEFVDPTFLFIVPTIVTQYDSTLTTLTASQIGALVVARVITFEGNNLNRFDGKFRYSRFLNYIDGVDDSVTGSAASIKIEKRFLPSLTTKNTYTFSFNQSIVNPKLESAMSSSSFSYKGFTSYLEDDNNGIVRVYYYSENSKIIINSDIGTVDYTTGKIILTNFQPISYSGSYMSITVNPTSPNFSPIKNQILLISGTTIKVIEDSTNKLESTISTVGTIGLTSGTNDSGLTTVTSF